MKLEFFGYPGHRPFGLWADVETMYEALDQFTMQGVRVHISEFGMHCPHKMIGPVRRGEWTPELQAEYYKRYFSVCFSHPAVDAINMWGMGPKTWMKGAGLLDSKFEPKPAFHALKKLIHDEWRTRLDGMLGLEGALAFRGFHGGYEMRLKPDGTGEWVNVRFNVAPGTENGYTVTWDAAAGEARISAAE